MIHYQFVAIIQSHFSKTEKAFCIVVKQAYLRTQEVSHRPRVYFWDLDPISGRLFIYNQTEVPVNQMMHVAWPHIVVKILDDL